MGKRVLRRAVVLTLAVLLELGVWVPPASAGYPDAPYLHPELEIPEQAQRGGQGPGSSKNLNLVGFLDLQDAPFTVGDVWAHGDFAYVGGFGPGTPVRVVDISDPTNPQWVGELHAPPGSSPQDVKVAKVNTEFFNGDLLVVGNDGGVLNLSDPIKAR